MRITCLGHVGRGTGADGRAASSMSLSLSARQEVAASTAGAVEQAVLRSLGVIDQQARAWARQAPPEQQSTGIISIFHDLLANTPVKSA